MTVFISGGCKNGKSMLAQRLAREMMESGDDLEDTHTGIMLQRRNAEFSSAVEAEALRIIERAREKRRRENNETGQLSIFDMLQNDTKSNT